MKRTLPAEIKARLAAVRRELAGLGAEALLVTDMVNVRYLSGFTGSEAVLLVTRRGQSLLVDSRYTTQAAGQAPGYAVVQTARRPEELRDAAARLKVRRLAFEAEGISHARFLELKRAMKGVALVRMNDVIGRLRARKTAAEVRRIQRAADIARRAFGEVWPRVRPGMRETELAAALEARMRELGSEKAAFDTIVASGPRGALPHGVATGRKMRAGELVTVDFGAIFEGYQSDQTITFALGRPSAKLARIYATVREAHDRALARVRPGEVAREVDRAAREHIAAAGFGDYFGHGLGHGVGLETHEAPMLNARGKAVLAEGNVVTIEPGIYIPGLGGVRIEDMALVTRTGARVLTRSGGPLRGADGRKD
jgi:Xaa-Pro aminopeptidase